MKKGTKIVVGIVGAVFAFLFFKILFELVTVTLKKNALLKDIQTLKQDISKGELRKQTIYNDAGYVEDVARQKLGLVKDGETVFVITDGKKKK